MSYDATRIKNEGPEEEGGDPVFCEVCGRSTDNLTAIPDLYAGPMMACPGCVLNDVAGV
jgi:hypothetical protein